MICITKHGMNFDLSQVIFPKFTSRLVAFYIHINKVDYQKAEVSKQDEGGKDTKMISWL